MPHFKRRMLTYVISGVLSVAVQSAPCQSLISVPPSQIANIERLPACSALAPAGYKRAAKDGQAHGSCLVGINRASPLTFPSIQLPAGTKVVIEVTNARQNERLSFLATNSKVLPPDPFAGFVKAAAGPLASLVLTQKVVRGLDGPEVQLDSLDEEQSDLAKQLSLIQKSADHATAAITCLALYQFLGADFTCSPSRVLTSAEYESQKAAAQDLVIQAAEVQLPLQDLADLASKVKGFLDACKQAAVGKPPAARQFALDQCRDDTQRHLTNQARLTSAISDLQKAQTTLASELGLMKDSGKQPSRVAFELTTRHNVNTTITVSAQEEVLKGSSIVSSQAISTQVSNWAVSSGVGFSTLKFFTYSNSPIIVNGVPVLDSTGKVLTVVTKTETSPSIVTPVAFASYRIRSLSDFRWENKCHGGCAFLLTGGIGANLTSKSADFDAGPSFQIGSVMVTPSVHFGRENRLSNGVQVGQQLGSNPPSPLPTANFWVRKFGFALTYIIPNPLAGQ